MLKRNFNIVDEGKRQRFYIDGYEVSRDVWFKAYEQVQRLNDCRAWLKSKLYVRPWNAIRMRERAAEMQRNYGRLTSKGKVA